VNEEEILISKKNFGKKAIFFDSNDDMLSEKEILLQTKNGNNNERTLQKINV
jgi:hypothetical protein